MNMNASACTLGDERLRREYFQQDEELWSTPPSAQANWHQAPERGFTLHGHRLSSLYRRVVGAQRGLISGKSTFYSSCPKYSKPERVTWAVQGGSA